MSDMVKRVGRAIWLKLGSAELDECEEAARAAIEAMREPTEAMLERWVFSDQNDAKFVWQDMIDDALKPHKD